MKVMDVEKAMDMGMFDVGITDVISIGYVLDSLLMGFISTPSNRRMEKSILRFY